MNLVIDSIVYNIQKFGGISRMFNELIPRLLSLEPNLNLIYYKGKPVKGALPSEDLARLIDVSRVDKIFRPWRLWHNSYPNIKGSLAKMTMGGTRNKIWHSTYFTELPGWQGKVVVSVHDFAYPIYTEIFNDNRSDQVRQQMEDSIAHADRVICISKSTMQELQRFYPKTDNEKLRVVHLGRSEKFKVLSEDELPLSNHLPYPFLLFVGKRGHYKNFSALVEAYAAWSENKEIHLIVVGPKWSEEEKCLFRNEDWFLHVHNLGGVGDDLLIALYNQAKALVWPSLNEGFGLPLLEAMSCRCPIVASRIPVSMEVAGDIPLYFEPGSVDSLINALDQSLQLERLSDRLTQGEIRAREFSWEKAAIKWLDIYRELC